MNGDFWRFPTSPFAELERMRGLFDELFSDAGAADIRSVPRGTFPTVNVGATDDAVTVYAFVPGVDPGDLEVNVEGNLLTLSGRRDTTTDGDNRNYYRRERFSGEFRRGITLPEGLDGDKARARMRNGVLELTLPKREEVQPRRIQISAA